MQKKLSAFALAAIAYLAWPGTALSQDARALFSSGSGTSIENQSTQRASTTQQASPAVKAAKASGSASNQAGASSTTQQASPAEKAAKASGSASNQAGAYAGLSYSIFQQMGNGEVRKVSPKKSFNTGDRIRVSVRANSDGSLSVLNINPEGKSSVLSEQDVRAGVEVSVPDKGFLKFVGSKGIEQLIFVLSSKPLPKGSPNKPNMAQVLASSCPSAKSGTRSLVADDSSGNEFNVLEGNGSCAASKGSTRSLVVEVAENTGYGVVPATTLNDGQLLMLKINLRHE